MLPDPLVIRMRCWRGGRPDNEGTPRVAACASTHYPVIVRVVGRWQAIGIDAIIHEAGILWPDKHLRRMKSAILDGENAASTVKLAASGDEAALARLIAEHHEPTVRAAYVVVGDVELAREATVPRAAEGGSPLLNPPSHMCVCSSRRLDLISTDCGLLDTTGGTSRAPRIEADRT